MINLILKADIDKFFPEIGFEGFIKRFAVPQTQLDNMTLAECKELDQRVIEIANDLSLQMSVEEEKYNNINLQAQKIKKTVIYYCARGDKFEYDGMTNFNNTNKNALTNAEGRDAFAELILQRKISNKEIEDPFMYKSRSQILKNLWFSITEIGRRIDNWSMAESTRIKRMKN